MARESRFGLFLAAVMVLGSRGRLRGSAGRPLGGAGAGARDRPPALTRGGALGPPGPSLPAARATRRAGQPEAQDHERRGRRLRNGDGDGTLVVCRQPGRRAVVDLGDGRVGVDAGQAVDRPRRQAGEVDVREGAAGQALNGAPSNLNTRFTMLGSSV